MFLKHIDLTTALRPSYLPDEVLLFVQDNVGLYEGYVHTSSARRLRAFGFIKSDCLFIESSRSQPIKMAMST